MGLTAKKVYAILNGKIKKISGDVAELGTPLFYAGSVSTGDLLPLSPKLGAVYNIEQKSIYGEAGINVAWNGTVWDSLGPTFDLSLLLTKEEAQELLNNKVDKDQGVQNSGKIMGIGDDGSVIPAIAPRAFYDNEASIIRFTGNVETGNVFGEVTREEKTSEDSSAILFSNRLYVFPEMKNLNISLATPDTKEIANEYHFIFQSGTTATVLTLPKSVRSDMAVEANRIYEVSIVDNLLAWTSWAVTT